MCDGSRGQAGMQWSELRRQAAWIYFHGKHGNLATTRDSHFEPTTIMNIFNKGKSKA